MGWGDLKANGNAAIPLEMAVTVASSVGSCHLLLAPLAPLVP